MANKPVTLETIENGVPTRKIVQVDGKVLEVPSSTSLLAESSDTIETEITDGIIKSSLKKGSVSGEYLTETLQKKMKLDTLPPKKLFKPFCKLNKDEYGIQTAQEKICKGSYDISKLSNEKLYPNGSGIKTITFDFISGEENDEFSGIRFRSTFLEFIGKDGGSSISVYDLQSSQWTDEDYKIIKFPSDTILALSTQDFKEYISDCFVPLLDAEDIIILNEEDFQYSYTPFLFKTQTRNHTHNYGGVYTAKSILSRAKRCGQKIESGVPKRDISMTLFDLLEWLGIQSEGNSDELWYKKEQVRFVKVLGSDNNVEYEENFGFDVWGGLGRCGAYCVIPLRAPSPGLTSQEIAEATIFNSDILNIRESTILEDVKNFKWARLYPQDNDEINFLNFFVRMGVGQVIEEKNDNGNWLRYLIQDVCRVSVRMQFDIPTPEDSVGDYVGEMIISFKGEMPR